jgi:tetrahydromethanopterin S-methyltransferase subunit G
MEPGSIAAWAAVALAVASLVNTWVMVRSKASADAHKDLADKVDKVEERVAIVEAEMEHLPDREATHRLELALAKLEGRFDTIDERLKPVAAMADRFQNYMLRERP